MYVYSRCLVRVIYEQGEVIGRLNQKFHNDSKGTTITSTTMGGMGQDLHNLENVWNIMEVRVIRWKNGLRLVIFMNSVLLLGIIRYLIREVKTAEVKYIFFLL